MTIFPGMGRAAGTRSRRAGILPLTLALIAMTMLTGCFSYMERTELKLDEIGRRTHSLQEQQGDLSQEVTRIRSLLESEGLVDDERRAELLTRLRTLEQSVENIEARMQEQETMLWRMSASLDQLTRQSWQGADGAMPGADAAMGELPGGEAPAGAASGIDTLYLKPDGADSLAPAEVADMGDGSTELVIYDAAMRDFSRGSYALAREGFEELLTRFPRSQLADNAAYWAAETLYAVGNFADARQEFAQVIGVYPESDILTAARLKLGYCQLELGSTDAAVAIFRLLVREDPESSEAEIAAHKLEELGVSP